MFLLCTSNYLELTQFVHNFRINTTNTLDIASFVSCVELKGLSLVEALLSSLKQPNVLSKRTTSPIISIFNSTTELGFFHMFSLDQPNNLKFHFVGLFLEYWRENTSYPPTIIDCSTIQAFKNLVLSTTVSTGYTIFLKNKLSKSIQSDTARLKPFIPRRFTAELNRVETIYRGGDRVLKKVGSIPIVYSKTLKPTCWQIFQYGESVKKRIYLLSKCFTCSIRASVKKRVTCGHTLCSTCVSCGCVTNDNKEFYLQEWKNGEKIIPYIIITDLTVLEMNWIFFTFSNQTKEECRLKSKAFCLSNKVICDGRETFDDIFFVKCCGATAVSKYNDNHILDTCSVNVTNKRASPVESQILIVMNRIFQNRNNTHDKTINTISIPINFIKRTIDIGKIDIELHLAITKSLSIDLNLFFTPSCLITNKYAYHVLFATFNSTSSNNIDTLYEQNVKLSIDPIVDSLTPHTIQILNFNHDSTGILSPSKNYMCWLARLPLGMDDSFSSIRIKMSQVFNSRLLIGGNFKSNFTTDVLEETIYITLHDVATTTTLSNKTNNSNILQV